MSLQHLYAMGIQPWQLKSKTETPYLLISDEADEMSDAALQLLNAMLASIDLKKEPILTSDTVKTHMSKAQPRLLLILGPVAAQRLLNCDTTLDALRGKVHHFANTAMIVIHHPAHLLQNPKDKRQTFDDLCMVQHILI